jgi:Tol biopolymer transport system component
LFSGGELGGARANQIYRSVNGVYSAPERLSFSDPQGNFIDPYIDPDEWFIIFSANRPGVGSPDIHICLQKDGKWGEPINLGESVNSPTLENAPSLAPDGKTLYFTSMRLATGAFPKTKENFSDVEKRLRNIENGGHNIWRVDISEWLNGNTK